jgi:hypothetical protein
MDIEPYQVKYNMDSRITLENFHSIWASILIRATDKYTMPPEVIKVNNSTISTLGNFSASTGKGKSKKTFNVCAIVASAITGKKVLNYEAHFPESKRKILYFDTEQSSYHCHKVLERINRLAGFPAEEDLSLIEFVKLREYNPIDRRQIIELALAERPDVGLVIIDGLRDLLFDINSSIEAAEVIGLLMRWTSQYNLHIHTVLHLNKADDNVRGHIGTELNHKAETILQISRNEEDGKISEVHASLIRDRDFPPFAFQINDEGLPELIEGFEFKPKSNRKAVFDYEIMAEELHRKALEVAFAEITVPILYTPLLGRLCVGYASIGFERSRNVLVNLLKFLVKNQIVVKEGKGYVFNRDFHYTPLPAR